MADLTDAQWVDEVIAVVAGLLDGSLTQAAADARLTTATQNWPTRTLSNADLAQRVSRFMARLNGLLLTNGPPPASMGDLNTFAYDTANGALYGPKTASGWGTPVSLVGPAGPPIELQKSATHVQYRTIGAANWTNLIALADLKGADGLEVSLRSTATHIQWRMGAGEWADLIALAALKGADGQEISLQRTATHIQWRLGDGEWADLFALADVKGDPGANGWTQVEAIVVDGDRRVKQIVDWIGGTGTKPATGKYVGAAGLVDTAAEATDVRGPGGSGSGDMQGANNLSDLTDDAVARTNLDVYSKGESDARYPVLSGGKVSASVLPALAITDVFPVTSQAAMLALDAQRGDVAVRSDIFATFILAAEPATTLANWLQLPVPTDVVQSVAGLQGAITGAALKAALALAISDVTGLETALAAIPAKATGAELRTATNDAKFLTPKALSDADAFVPVAASGAFTLDFAAGRNFVVTLSANATMAVPSNMKDGQSGTIYFIQPAAGSRTLGLATAIKKFGTYTLSTAPNAVDRCGYVVRSGVLELTALEKGLA